jgi:hypothetical protein
LFTNTFAAGIGTDLPLVKRAGDDDKGAATPL